MDHVRSQRDVRCSKIIWHKFVQEQSELYRMKEVEDFDMCTWAFRPRK